MFRKAIYPGSFDPATLGHLDMIERASGIFDEVVVGVGINRAKRGLLLPEERVEALAAATARLDNVIVAGFDGLLVDFVRERGSHCIVRGLRATADFEYEFQMAMVNRRLAAEVETVFLMTSWEHSYLSSTLVREVAVLGGDVTGMVPRETLPFLRRAVERRRAEGRDGSQ